MRISGGILRYNSFTLKGKKFFPLEAFSRRTLNKNTQTFILHTQVFHHDFMFLNH